MSVKYSQYENEEQWEEIKCDRLVELGKAFEEAGVDGYGAFAVHLEGFGTDYKWNVDLYLLDRLILLDDSIDDHIMWDKAGKIFNRILKHFPEPQLTDKEKASRVVQLIEGLKANKLLDESYDSEYMTAKISEEFHLNEPS